MATLPNPDAVGEIDTQQLRRQGIGSWQPDVISRATQQEGSGLERLGGTVGQVGEEFQNSADQIQYAQAMGAAHSAAIDTHASLPAVTDPSKVLSSDPTTPAPVVSDYTSKVNDAANMISNPRLKAKFQAEIQPISAQVGAAAMERGRTLNNQAGVASLETNTTNIINQAATIDDEKAAGAALDGINQQIAPLVTSGAITQEQAVTFRKQAAEQFVEARQKTLLAQVEAAPPGQRDYTKLNEFSAAHGLTPITVGGASNDNGPSTGPVSTPAGLAAYKQTIGKIESASGTNEGHLASYYQFEPDTWAKYGAGGTKGTAAGEDTAINRLTADNNASLTKSLGREPTPAELYLAHQQGAGGAAALLANPNTPAGQIVPPANIRSNGGDPNAPAAQFVALWANKYAKAAGQPNAPATPVSAFASAMPAPGAPSVAAASAFRAGLAAAAPPPDQVASLGPVGLPVAPAIGAGTTTGVLPFGVTPDDISSSTATRAPPSSQWPDGAQSVVGNADGSLSYQMTDGSYQPVKGSKATGAPHPQLPMPPQGSILSLLPPEKRAALQLQTVQEIQRLQRQDAMANQRDNRGDIAAIGNSVKQMESGLPLGNDVWEQQRAAYANSPDPQVRYNFAVADATRNTLQRFQGSPPAEISTAIANMQSEYAKQINTPGGDQNGVLAQVIKSSQNYLTTYRQAIAKDPIGRAAMEGAITGVKALDRPSPTFAQDVTDRVQQAKDAARMFGQDTPTFMRPDERIALRKLAAAGGQPMIDLAKGIVAGAGTDATSIFKQIGKDAPPLAQIGEWAVDPNADHSTQIERYANWIAAEADPQAKKNIVRVGDSQMRNNAGGDPLHDAAAAFTPDQVGRLRNTANILASDTAQTAHVDPRTVSQGLTGGLPQDLIPNAYHEAVGGTRDPQSGTWFGGIAKIAGSSWHNVAGGYNTIVPTNMRQDKFETALGQINQSDVNAMGPPPISVGANGGVLSAEDVKKGQFVAVPDKATGLFSGRYRVMLPDPAQNNAMAPVLNQSGKPWIFDMNRAQQNGLDQRVPGAFMAPISPATPPMRGQFRNVKGLSLSPDVASSDTGSEPTSE